MHLRVRNVDRARQVRARIDLGGTNVDETDLARAQELRETMLRLKAAGKKVVAMVLTAGDAEYLVASAADKIYAAPEALLAIDGFAATPTFLGGSMSKLGVHWDVARVGAFKNAPDQLTRSGQADQAERVLATAVEDKQPRPLFWTVEHVRGRVFVSIPGHYSWTFDDPLYRVLLLRSIAWSAGERTDRFNDLVTPGALIQP